MKEGTPDQAHPRKAEFVERLAPLLFGAFLVGKSMDDVAKELGISKRTLYEIFPTKESLFGELVEARFDDLKAKLAAAGSGPLPFRTRLDAVLSVVHGFMGGIDLRFALDLRKQSPALFERMMAKRQAVFLAFFSEFLEEGRRAGVVRADVRTDLFILLVQGLLANVLQPEILTRVGVTPSEIGRFVWATLMEGVLTKEGREGLDKSFPST